MELVKVASSNTVRTVRHVEKIVDVEMMTIIRPKSVSTTEDTSKSSEVKKEN